MKMKKRQNLRDQKQKAKELIKMRKMMSHQLNSTFMEQLKEINEAKHKEEEKKSIEKTKVKEEKPPKQEKADVVQQPKKDSSKVNTKTNDDGDQVMSISKKEKPKKDKKRVKKDKLDVAEPPAKKVRFDLSKNKVTEFFKHGKVATRVFER